MASQHKVCPDCGKPLSVQRASQRKKRCYRCERAAIRQQARAAHDHRVEQLYGLRPGEYRLLLAAQGGHCAIKGCPARGIAKALAVDHDHKLGLHNRKAVRGLTCALHNGWIGKAGDNPEVFESLARYLREPPAQEVLT
jgi:hypothetical protein